VPDLRHQQDSSACLVMKALKNIGAAEVARALTYELASFRKNCYTGTGYLTLPRLSSLNPPVPIAEFVLN